MTRADRLTRASYFRLVGMLASRDLRADHAFGAGLLCGTQGPFVLENKIEADNLADCPDLHARLA
eukprot:11650-Pleurochrysis_carterae.AAC.1